MIVPSELEKLVEYLSLLEDIIELQKQVAPLLRRMDALAEYMVRRKEAAELRFQLR